MKYFPRFCRIGILLFLWVVIPITIKAYSIVNNSGTSSEDSLTVSVLSLDSLGSPTNADSFFVVVFKSGTNTVVFSDSGIATTMTGIDTVAAGGGLIYYYYHRAVADIDGIGTVGQYSGIITAKKNTVLLLTPNRFSFQVIGYDYNSIMSNVNNTETRTMQIRDSVTVVLDSLRSQDDWVSSFNPVTDSVFARANVKRISDDSTAADNFETMLDGSGGKTLTLGKLVINGANGSGGSFAVTNSSGNAVVFKATGGSGAGFYTVGDNIGKGMVIEGGNGGAGLRVAGHAQGYGIWVTSDSNIDIYAPQYLRLIADSIKGRDSNLYAEGFWHKLAQRADSGAVGGSADSASIARWVWNTPQSNHTTSGTFGKYLDAEISGIGSGSGLYAYEVQIYDSTIGQVISGAEVVVRNISQTSLQGVGKSDGNGLSVFNLNTDSFLVMASAPGYIFDAFDTVIVTGSGKDTVFGYQFNPGTPAAPNLCRVYGYLYNVNGQPQEGAKVTASLPSGVVQYGNVIVSPFTVSSTTDSSGYFYLDLIPSDSLVPQGELYEISISRTDGTVLRQRLKIPVTSSWRLVW
ncbi:MAG: hypothetical protein GXO93_05050 [FCB group bacterium]|nr:hypothetical protein [FCB group bacterium]